MNRRILPVVRNEEAVAERAPEFRSERKTEKMLKKCPYCGGEGKSKPYLSPGKEVGKYTRYYV